MHGAPGLLLQQVLEPGNEVLVAFGIVRFIAQDNVALPVKADAIRWIGQVFRGQPEVERVFGHQVERPPGGQHWGPAFNVSASSLPTKEMCPIG
jgi:hypothetical protein